MARIDTDVAVIGAGPAGIAAARGLQAAGLDVTLIDPGLAPNPRIESLPTTGLALADSLGLGGALAAATLGRAGRMRMCWRGTPELRDFGPDAPLLLDRVALHRALRDAVPGLRVIPARARPIPPEGDRHCLQAGGDTVAARLVIDARGRAGLRAPRGQGRPGGDLVALAFTGEGGAPRTAPAMQVEALAEGWLWACLLPDGRVAGALFGAAGALAGLDRHARQAHLAGRLAASGLGLPDRLVAGGTAPAMLAAVHDPFAAPGVLRVGDAALARDPIAAHGIVHALRSGAQAAAAAATLLDPACDGAAAHAFVRDRHRRAVAAARQATAQSYAEQALFRSPFWDRPAAPPAPPPGGRPWPSLGRPLALAAPLRQVAVLDGDRIRWAPAIWLHHSAEAVPRLGPLTAARLADLLDAPAPVATLSARLERAIGPGPAQAILRRLMDEGALAPAGQAGMPAPSSA